MDATLKDWNTATSNLPWGVQRVFMETLEAVKDEKIHLVWGRDYRDGKPCLVNAVASMLTTGGGHGVPMDKFRDVVAAFDSLNYQLRHQGVNADGYVSPLAAEILIRNFGELKPEPDIDTSTVGELSHGAYIEPTDEEMAQDFLNAMTAPAPEEIQRLAEEGNDVARFAADYISRQ
jgi:hypothetical protein